MMRIFFDGALVCACLVIALFFVRHWRTTGDRFFLLFSLAFTALGLHWAWLGLDLEVAVARHQSYVVRLAAFVLFIAAIVDKNRRKE